ncbi:MAG: hypothetical protein PVF52_00860, partial [Granulosicoccaceae bacterium]
NQFIPVLAWQGRGMLFPVLPRQRPCYAYPAEDCITNAVASQGHGFSSVTVQNRGNVSLLIEKL